MLSANDISALDSLHTNSNAVYNWDNTPIPEMVNDITVYMEAGLYAQAYDILVGLVHRLTYINQIKTYTERLS